MNRRALLQWSVASTSLWGARWAVAGMREDLRTAIIRDSDLQVRELLQKGVDPNSRDHSGFPALVQATQLESWRALNELLGRKNIRLDEKNSVGESALMLACIKGHLALVQKLLDRGASINHPGWAPLHYAASANTKHSDAIVELLLERYAYVDAESPNKTTPLMLAAQYGSQAMVDALLDAGADVQLRNQQGLSAVDFAQLSGRQFMVDRLRQAYEATRKPKASW